MSNFRSKLCTGLRGSMLSQTSLAQLSDFRPRNSKIYMSMCLSFHSLYFFVSVRLCSISAGTYDLNHLLLLGCTLPMTGIYGLLPSRGLARLKREQHQTEPGDL